MYSVSFQSQRNEACIQNNEKAVYIYDYQNKISKWVSGKGLIVVVLRDHWCFNEKSLTWGQSWQLGFNLDKWGRYWKMSSFYVGRSKANT